MKTTNALALALLVLSPVAWSQEEEEVYVLDDIKVIGNKEGRTYTETPESVTILPPQRLNRGDQNNSLEILNGQANVQTSSTRAAENFTIRGVSNTGVTGFQKDNLASIFVDDIFQTDLAMKAGSFEVWDIQSLEIHRGPQSTSQGVNSMVGAIILQHMQAQQEDEASLKLGYGSFNRRELGGMANKTLFNDKFAIRFSANKDMNDGFVKNRKTGNDKWGEQDKTHLSLDMKYFFDDKSELRFLNKFMETDNGGNYTIGSNPFDYRVNENYDYKVKTQSNQHSIQFTKPLNEQVSNKTTFAFSQSEQDTTFDADGRPTDEAGERIGKFHDQFMSLENVLQFQNSKIKNALGFHAHQFRSFDYHDATLLMGTLPIQFYQDTDKQRETYALFDSLLYKLDEHHALNLGLRFEYVKTKSGNYYNPIDTGNGGVDAQLAQLRGNHKDEESSTVILPKLGYIYTNGNQTWGLTYAQGYRIGGTDVNRWQGKVVNYDPEKTDNYELSWKLTEKKFKLTTNVFYTYWKDQQVEVEKSTSTFDSQVENAGTSELYGAEVEGSYKWDSGDSLTAGVGYVQTRFLSFNNGDDTYTGNEFAQSPNLTAQTTWGHYYTDAINSNLTLRHVGKTYVDTENEEEAPSQFYFDANLQYNGESYVVELNVKNVLDQKYVLNRTDIYSNTYKQVNRPREINTRVTWFF